MAEARILVVEDEAIVAKDICRTLVRLGYAVAGTAIDAASALALAASQRPDLILMDIRLKGGIDGIDLAVTIKNRVQVPVIFLTAYSDEATIQRARRIAAYGYLIKPFEERELYATVEMALYRHQAEQRIRQMEQWLNATITSMGDGVITTDLGGQITLINPQAELLTGWAKAEALGRMLPDVYRVIRPDAPFAAPPNFVAQVREQGICFGLPPGFVLVSRQATAHPIDQSCAPIRDAQGQPIGVVIIFRERLHEVPLAALAEH